MPISPEKIKLFSEGISEAEEESSRYATAITRKASAVIFAFWDVIRLFSPCES